MFLGRKNQYCEHDCTTKHNLQIQCDLYQITNGIFHITRTKKKKSHNSCGNTKDLKWPRQSLRKKNGAGGISLSDSDFTTKLKSSRQYGTGTKTEIYTNVTRQKAQK